MKARVLSVLGGCSLLAATLPAAAGNVDIGVNAGTLGVGPTIGFTVVPNQFDLRLTSGFLKYSHDVTSSDMHYDGHLKLKNAALLADWHPFRGVFRITLGAVYNRNEINLVGHPQPGKVYTAPNGATYVAAPGDEAHAHVDFNKFAPYIGIGWGRNDRTPGLHLTADIGALYQGNPSSTVTINSTTPVTQVMADQYAQSAQEQLNHDVRHYKWYPVAQVGLLYRF